MIPLIGGYFSWPHTDYEITYFHVFQKALTSFNSFQNALHKVLLQIALGTAGILAVLLRLMWLLRTAQHF